MTMTNTGRMTTIFLGVHVVKERNPISDTEASLTEGKSWLLRKEFSHERRQKWDAKQYLPVSGTPRP